MKFFSVLLLILVIGCGTANRITGTWKAPNTNLQQYTKIFVAALTADVPVRNKVEDELSDLLTEHGIEAVKSLGVLIPDVESTALDVNEPLLQKVLETGSDAIMTIAVIDQTSEERYVPDSGRYRPINRFGYYRTFGGYYGNRYGRLYQPGYYTTDKTYYLETNVYDAESGNLVWSTQSETLNPVSLDSFLEAYKSSMAEKLKEDGLLVSR